MEHYDLYSFIYFAPIYSCIGNVNPSHVPSLWPSGLRAQCCPTVPAKVGRYGLSPQFLTMILLLMCCYTQADGAQVNRLNMGLIFTHEDTVQAVVDYWPHTYQIPLPEVFTIQQQDVSCNDNSSNRQACEALKIALQEINKIRYNYMTHLNHALVLAKEVMPEPVTDVRPRSNSRSKRALLPFMGDIAHSLFGTATDRDVNRIKAHITLLEKCQV